MPMRGAEVNLTRAPSLSSQRRLERTRSSRLSERSILRSFVNRPGPSAHSTPRMSTASGRPSGPVTTFSISCIP